MKRILAAVLLTVMLSGCGQQTGEMERAIALRSRMEQGSGCTFDATITADYGDEVYVFEMNCQVNAEGKLTFCVIAPESISGISGVIEDSGGYIVFDGKLLSFEMLADGLITPVSGPWLMIHTLRCGYIAACGQAENGIQIGIDDTYKDSPIHLEFWTDNNDLPLRGEVVWQERRILTIDVKNFAFL